MSRPDWFYDDLRQVGIDFADAGQVATYDDRQNDDPAADRALLDRIGVEPTHHVADIGCGTGLLACEAARRSACVHAVDVSAAMLARTEARAAAAGLTNIRPVQAGFLSFDPGPRTLDLVTTKFAFHHLPDFWKAMALVRVNRMLKPGGRLFLRDVVFSFAPAEAPQAIEGWIGWMLANTGYPRAEVATHVREEHSTFAWIVECLLERTGFRLLWSDIGGPTYADYFAEKNSEI
ncbi:MAG: class I SAM-dependent methyltransferase [Dongiaceae bacterium]